MAAPTDPARLAGTLAYVEARRSGSDLRLLALLDALWRDPAGLQAAAPEADLRRTILGFKYWLDEPGADNVRYWTEGATLCFSVCAYLAGRFYPDEIFVNSGRRGAEVAALGERRIRFWLAQRFRLGMTEWLTSETIVVVLASLRALIEWSMDDDLVRRASGVVDLVLLDVAMFSFEGEFGPAAARVTRDPGMRQVLAWLRDTPVGPVSDPLVEIIVREGRYTPPPVLQSIGYDERTSVSWSTFGLNPTDVGREADSDPDLACLLSWQIGAYNAPETAKWSARGVRKWGLSTNRNLVQAKRTLPLPLPPRRKNDRDLLPRARVVSFRTRHYHLSSAQGYRVGEHADARPWQAVLPGGICITTIQPKSATGTVDSGLMPAVGQYEHLLLASYDTRRHDARPESKLLLPFSLCDDSRLGRTWIAARVRGTFIGILSVSPLELVARDEVLQRGPVTGWAVVMSDRSQTNSLAEFIRSVKASSLAIDRDTLHLRQPGNQHFSLDAKGSLTTPLGLVVPPPGRYRNPWVQPFSLRGQHDVLNAGHSLRLEWDAGARVWS